MLISSLCLYVALRLNPYVDHKLERLHIMALTAQCITLFYALLLELQDFGRRLRMMKCTTVVLFLLRTERTSNLINRCAIFAPDGTYQQSDQLAGTFRMEQK